VITRRAKESESGGRGSGRASRPARPVCGVLVFLAVTGLVAQAAEINVRIPESVGQFGKLEISVDIDRAFANPYDPNVVRLDAAFDAPSGVRKWVPGFFFEGYDPLLDLPTHKSGWRVRFAPEEIGTYWVRLFLAERGSARTRIGGGRFAVAAPPRGRPSPRARGFVWRSRLPSHYFVFNGLPRPSRRTRQAPLTGRSDAALRGRAAFFPVGMNYCWGRSDQPENYLQGLERLADSGVNCVRVWTCPWWLAIESSHHGRRKGTIGRYEQKACALLDTILEKCEERGLYVMLCFEQFGNLQPAGGQVGQWPNNPYNERMGGPCGSTSEFFRNPAARTHFKKRLRYLIARWGYSTALMAWELFNEVELVVFESGDINSNRPLVAAWHKEMAEYLRANDPWGHLICTSSDESLQQDLFLAGAVDFLQFHLYQRRDAKGSISDYARAVAGLMGSRVTRFGTPLLLGEYGEWKNDPQRTSLRRGMWAALASGAAGAGLYWWEGDLDDAIRVFEPVARFVRDVPWREQRFRPARITDLATADAGAPANEHAFKDVVIPTTLDYGQEIKGGVPCTVHPDGSMSAPDAIPKFLHGSGKASLKQPYIFDVEFKRVGAVAVKVNTVSDSAVMDVYVDSRKVGTKVLITGPNNTEAKRSEWFKEWMTYQDVFDTEYSFPIPEGTHRIRIVNSGKDWVKVDYVRLIGYKPPGLPKVAVTGIVGRDMAILYAYRLGRGWTAQFGQARGEQGPALRPVEFDLHGLPDGEYVLEQWDPASGNVIKRPTAHCRNGVLSVRSLRLADETALKIVRE